MEPEGSFPCSQDPTIGSYPELLAGFYAGFLLGLFFDPEDGGDMFLQNIGNTRRYIPEDRTLLDESSAHPDITSQISILILS
jgi:hypothetical protein